jgi:hypothetical protein
MDRLKTRRQKERETIENTPHLMINCMMFISSGCNLLQGQGWDDLYPLSKKMMLISSHQAES